MEVTKTQVAPPSQYRTPFVNNSGADIPGYAIVQSSGAAADGREFLVGTKPGLGGSSPFYFANSPDPVAPASYGIGSTEWPCRVLVTALPALGGELGPVAGNFAMHRNGKGFTYLGGLIQGLLYDTAMVAPRAGAAAAQDDFPIIRFWNLTGSDLPYGAVVGFGDALDPPPDTIGKIPTFLVKVAETGKPFAVLLADCPNGEVADAGAVSVVNVKVNVTSSSHTLADVIGGPFGSWETLVSSASEGYPIVWRANQGIEGAQSLGIQWARVLLQKQTASDDIRGITYTMIPGATRDTITDKITPGKGKVIIYQKPTSGDAGASWSPPSSNQQDWAENWMKGEVKTGKPVLLRFSRQANDGSKIYCVVAEGCDVL